MSSFKPFILTYKAEAAITKGQFVKFGADDLSVLPAGDGEDVIGIAQNDAAAVGDPVEVAKPGGGGRVKLSATLARGAAVASNASGLAKAPASGDRVGAVLEESGAANEIVSCSVLIYQAN